LYKIQVYNKCEIALSQRRRIEIRSTLRFIIPLTSCFILTHADTYHVPEDYETIHQALGSLSSNDTVIVREYYYRERIPRFDYMPTVICEGWEPEFYEIDTTSQRSKGSRWVPGDANNDGAVTTADVVYLSRYLYSPDKLHPPQCPWDPDGDGDWDASDLTYLVKYSYFNGSPPTSPEGWTGPIQVNESDTLSDFYPHIYCSDQGNHWATWWGHSDLLPEFDDVYAARWDLNIWEWVDESRVSASDSLDDFHPSIYVDEEEGVWCAWTGKTGGWGWEIYYARWDSTSGWYEEGMVNEPDTVNDAAVTIGGGNGQLWVIYGGFNESDPEREEIYAVRWTGDDWGPEIIIADLGYESITGQKAAFDQLGNPHVVWGESVDNMDVYYVYFDGDSWSEKVLVNDPDNNDEEDRDPGIAVDDSGHVHIVWAANEPDDPYDYEIMYRYFDGENWSEEIQLNLPDGYGDYRSRVAASSPDNVWVVWDKGYSFWEHDIIAIHFNDSIWELEETISAPECMCDMSSAIDTDGQGNPWVIWSGIVNPQNTRSEVFINVHFTVASDVLLGPMDIRSSSEHDSGDLPMGN
jgi:hypothetical protein